MTSVTTKLELSQPQTETAVHLFDNWFDPIEAGVRARVRDFIEAMIEAELETAVSRPRYGRRAKESSGDSEGAERTTGHRHGHRSRSLMGTFGKVEIQVPRARLNTADGKTTEWKSQALRAYQRRTLAADALIASSYLAGTNTRRVRRALAAVFGGAVGKDTVSRVWRKVKSDWEAWNARSLADEPIVRLILDGTVVRVRLDRKARLVERFEWHYTPKHGSWLDLAESELGVLSSQCLDRRIPDKQTLVEEIAAWEHDRNANHTKSNWHFTTPNARIKLQHLYPSI